MPSTMLPLRPAVPQPTQRRLQLLRPPQSLRCLRLQPVVGSFGARRAARERRIVLLVQRQSTDTETTQGEQESGSATPQQAAEEPKWGLFDGKAYLQPFEVPWGAKEVVLGMVGWGITFLLVGLAFIPVARSMAGTEGFSALPQADRALFTLANQVVATAVGVGVVQAAVRAYQPLQGDLLKADWSGPFAKPRGWLVWGLLGVSLSPAVVYTTSVVVEALGYDGVTGRGTVDSVTSIISLDFTTYAALFSTTAIFAPILEETVFRGFLLASLTKWMPVPAAVLLSSAAFGMAHFTPKDFPQLAALGVLLGLTYVRSRNLLTPMLIHGAWNGTVLTVLFMLTAMGVDIKELIQSGAY